MEVLRVDDALFELHDAGVNHPERPARLLAARAGVKSSGVATRELPAIDADRALLAGVHSPALLDRLDLLRGVRGMIDADTFVSPRSVEAATRAAGGAATLARALVAGEAERGIALLRPPGHHAESGESMGFCLLNNVAVAARAARLAGAARVAIVDIDVHHGNGTQEIFWRDPDVLYVSLHQWPFYPGTGAVEERGEGDGEGATVNVPLAAGADDDVYREAMRRVVQPVLAEFAADVLLVSAGFDAFEGDPLASMRVTPRGFADMIAALLAGGASKVGLFLEGGYDLAGLEACVAASMRALDSDAAIAAPSRRIDAQHLAEIDRAAASAARAWSALR